MEITSHYKTVEKTSHKGINHLMVKPKKLQTSSFNLKDRYYSASLQIIKKNRTPNRFSLERVSPFLLLGFFLVGLFPYMFITGIGTIHTTLFLLLVFAFLEVNLLIFDFAIWNYFKGKKIFHVWLIEVPLTLLVIHLLV